MQNEFLILLACAYILGSVHSAIIICHILGLQSPREMGSGNPGATNVLRLAGKKVAAVTLIADAIKGVVPVIIGWKLGLETSLLCWVGLFAVIGHILPIFFGFKGGKGVATTMGALLAINLYLGLAVIATWLVMAKVFKISSLSAIIAIILMPSYAYFILTGTNITPIIILAILVLIKHHSNIKRLFKGEEKIIK